jgi:polysaccharide biosynthesis protein VpsQ
MKWLTVLFTLFIILIIVLADTGNLGIVGFIYHIPYADKLGHFILYGILVLLINLTLLRSNPSQSPNRIVLLSGLTLAILIGIEELSQQHFANRTFDLVDLSASYLGVVFFSWVSIKTT